MEIGTLGSLRRKLKSFHIMTVREKIIVYFFVAHSFFNIIFFNRENGIGSLFNHMEEDKL